MAEAEIKEVPRVVVTALFINICTMQVCAIADATDEEILAVCNQQNPSGTSNGWSEVIRVADEDNMFKNANKLPVRCDDNPERMHFLILC